MRTSILCCFHHGPTCIYVQGFHSLIINVSRFGLAVRREAGKRRDLGSNPLRLSFLFKSCGLWLCPSQLWNIKMALIAACPPWCIGHSGFDWLIDDHLYSAILRSLEQTHCARLWFYVSDKLFIARFLNIHWSGVSTYSAGMAGATWNCSRLGASSVYTIQPCTVSLHAKPHT